jgi:formylmethanofuran dehydrogenase subunit E
MIECDDCNESILEYVSTVEGAFVCDDCFKKGGYKEH